MNYVDNSYRAICLRVVDGDTVQLDVDLGLRVRRDLYVRLVGIDAPEKRGGTKEAGIAAARYLEQLISGRSLVVQFEKGKSFDRWLGTLWVVMSDGDDTQLVNVQDCMVKVGHAQEVK